MRWKLLTRRLSVSAPRMIVRSHLPWPLRWAVFAMALGFSAALALWAFEFGKEIAGLDRGAKEELARLRADVESLRAERDKAQSIANTADSLLKTERAAQERLAQQLKAAEEQNLTLKADLGFFEKLVPAGTTEGLSIRSVQVEPWGDGKFRFQVLVMQSGRSIAEFRGRLELSLSGTREGKPWTSEISNGTRPVQLKQYLRVEGIVEVPMDAVVKTVQVRVLDSAGTQRAVQNQRV